ncbi:MAG TPA: cytochrome d ubiquinol oxidase subunit II [Bacteroidales bacterium]|mgnify:CR=1 FL=1|nr:cytochrome d ubiquinol oxidase subunit II [Bacteroidales bacterium]
MLLVLEYSLQNLVDAGIDGRTGDIQNRRKTCSHIGVFLIGVAVGTFFTGSDFLLNEFNQVFWLNKTRGLEAVFNFQNVTLGLAVFSLSRILGAQYFINSIGDDNIAIRSRRQVGYNTLLFLVFFLTFIFMLLLSDGFSYSPDNGIVSMEPNKYFHNLIEMPAVMLLFITGVVLVLSGIIITWFKKSTKGIWFSGPGTILTVLALLLLAGLNNTCFYPSASYLQSSLTIQNSSSSQFTLTVMSYVSLFIPFVLFYIIIAWRAINKKRINQEDLSETDHKY